MTFAMNKKDTGQVILYFNLIQNFSFKYIQSAQMKYSASALSETKLNVRFS